MDALPLPREIAFEMKRDRRRMMEITAEEMAARAHLRRVWQRSRGLIAAVLVFVCVAMWSTRYHQERVALLERENAELHALLLVDRQPVTVVATGCGRNELATSLSKAAGSLDQFRYDLRHARGP